MQCYFDIGFFCEVFFIFVNGDFICVQDSVGVNCSLSCKEGYDFIEGLIEKYYCVFEDGIWRLLYFIEWLDCVSKF